MSIRVPWDKYEAVILLDGWLRVKEGIPRSEVITLVSYKLRKKAVNQGVAIDSVFRNTNGINFQLMSMASAFEATDMGKAPLLFPPKPLSAGPSKPKHRCRLHRRSL